jgi:hypothetical protein
MSQVYFIRVGKHIKIGVTTNLESRLRSFRTASAEEITVLLTIPGDRAVESHLHGLFNEERIRGEFFQDCWLIGEFIRFAKEQSFAFALEYATKWKQRFREPRKTKEQIRQERLAEERRRTGWDGRFETYRSIFATA